jgi:hypothetical protein
LRDQVPLKARDWPSGSPARLGVVEHLVVAVIVQCQGRAAVLAGRFHVPGPQAHQAARLPVSDELRVVGIGDDESLVPRVDQLEHQARSVRGTTWTERNNRHFWGMLSLKEEYGVRVRTAGTTIIEAAWAAAAEADGLPAGGGPGHEDDPLVNKAVERHAEDRVMGWLETGGWACERVGKPLDLRCLKADRELHVEVKGTQGNGKVVELTRNEVAHNQETCTWGTGCDERALFVVTGITVATTTLTCSDGNIGYVWPWKIRSTILCDGDLIPTRFDYTVPELTAVIS